VECHYSKDKALLERVQHRFTHLFKNQKDLLHEARLRNLKLWSLEECRNRSDLVERYKMIHGFSKLPFNQFFTFSSCNTTRGHSQKLAKHHSNTNIKLFSFSARVIIDGTVFRKMLLIQHQWIYLKDDWKDCAPAGWAFSLKIGLLKLYWLNYVFDMYDHFEWMLKVRAHQLRYPVRSMMLGEIAAQAIHTTPIKFQFNTEIYVVSAVMEGCSELSLLYYKWHWFPSQAGYYAFWHNEWEWILPGLK